MLNSLAVKPVAPEILSNVLGGPIPLLTAGENIANKPMPSGSNTSQHRVWGHRSPREFAQQYKRPGRSLGESNTDPSATICPVKTIRSIKGNGMDFLQIPGESESNLVFAKFHTVLSNLLICSIL
jgi:hypothetical protein